MALAARVAISSSSGNTKSPFRVLPQASTTYPGVLPPGGLGGSNSGNAKCWLALAGGLGGSSIGAPGAGGQLRQAWVVTAMVTPEGWVVAAVVTPGAGRYLREAWVVAAVVTLGAGEHLRQAWVVAAVVTPGAGEHLWEGWVVAGVVTPSAGG